MKLFPSDSEISGLSEALDEAISRNPGQLEFFFVISGQTLRGDAAWGE